MKNNLVSIIMPVYNNEKHLEEAIKSILSQTYKDIELLILDDGSTDSSLSIIEKYAMENKNIRLISRDNKGVAYSIEELLSYASGEFIGRMNGDDLSYPERIETEVKYLKENNNISLVGSFVDIEITDYENEDDKILCEKIFNFKCNGNSDDSIKILNGNKICHGTFLSRSKIFKDNKYDLKLKSTEDIDLLLSLIMNDHKVYVIPKKLYLNRVNSDFIHKQKRLNDQYNREVITAKLRFLEKFIGKRNICLIGKSKYSNPLYETLNSTKVRVNNIIDEFNEKDIKDDYVIILNIFNRENIESKLSSMGKKNLKDFISL